MTKISLSATRQKRTMKLSYSTVPDVPFSTVLWLFYQWDEKLPDEEANRFAQRAIAYLSCAIYDAACSAGWSCRLSIPNGRRPAWILDGERLPVSLTLSDIDLSEKIFQFTIGPVVKEIGKLPGDRAQWEKLHAAFRVKFLVKSRYNNQLSCGQTPPNIWVNQTSLRSWASVRYEAA